MKSKSLVFIIVVLFIVGIIYLNKSSNSDEELYLADTKAGDVNGDGKVSASDYVLIRKYLLKTGSLNSDQKKRADINSDGKVNSSDYVAIRKIILNGGSSSGSSSSSESGLLYKDLSVVDSKYSYEVVNFNVLDYGADPTGAKDSTEAFNKALLAAANCRETTTCGGTVYAPKGKYLISNTIQVHTYTSLVGDLEEGTTNGTILMIKHGAGSTDINKSGMVVQVMGSVRNIAFWYPDQKVDGNGNVTPYPPTIQFGVVGTDGVTLENLYFVNSYTAMDFASARENNSIQYIRRIYGTPLHIGIINDTNYDTIKMDNINFSPKYWLNSGLSNIPSKDNLNKALRSSSTMPAGIVFQRLDWFFLANVNIDGYFFGIKFEKSGRNAQLSGAEGEIFDSKITDCYYPVFAYYVKHTAFTNVTLNATGGNQARAVHFSADCDFDYSFYNSNISSNGDYAIYHGGTKSVTIVNSKVNGKIGKVNASAQLSLVGDALTNTSLEGCTLNSYAEVGKKDYNRRVVTKPKSKNIIKINANKEEDITNKIKDAINKLKSIGGIVYIPNGVFNISGHIDVPSVIEIRGAVNWAHHRGYGGSTVLQTTYKGDSIFTLQSSSGINGLAIRQVDNENTSNIKEYPYVIKGNGSNIYIMNVVLTTVFNGIYLNGCDNHYVEHVWGEFYNFGINVDGGSKNGIIRDSHFTINVLYNNELAARSKALAGQTVIRVGNSSNETIFHTFTFGPNKGYEFDGAKDIYAVGIGVDYSNYGIMIHGGTTGIINNPLLVIRTANLWFDQNIGGNAPYDHHYIETAANYSGFVKINNSISWGSNNGLAFDLNGTGDLHFNAGIIENSASPAIKTSNASQTFNGMIIGYPKSGVVVQVNKGVSGFTFIGNICTDRDSCLKGVANPAGISLGYADPKKTCDTPSTPVTPSPGPDWEKTALYNTSVSASSATTKICGLGASGTLEYKGNCTASTKTTISNDCATITLKACANEVLSYRFNDSEWKTASGIGKYLIFGQAYNQLLYPGAPASNNSSNLGNWVSQCTKISDCVRSIGVVAANQSSGVDNETFVKRAYQGILGRSADAGGLSTWVGSLNSGTPRIKIIDGVVGSQEAIAIFNAWGYN